MAMTLPDDPLSIENPFLKKIILQCVCHDLFVLSVTELSASTDPYFAQLLSEYARQSGAKTVAPTGFLSLDVTVPNFALVPWQVIIEVRKMPAF